MLFLNWAWEPNFYRDQDCENEILHKTVQLKMLSASFSVMCFFHSFKKLQFNG